VSAANVPTLVREYVLAPSPEPPVDVRVIGVPAVPVVGEFEMRNAACEAAVKVNVSGSLVSDR